MHILALDRVELKEKSWTATQIRKQRRANMEAAGTYT